MKGLRGIWALGLLAAAAFPSFAADPASPFAVERGQYLVTAANCATCHTRPGGKAFTGGVPFVTPRGTIYSTNITPDAETGIGKWTVEDLRRAMHEGIAPGGRRLFPAFPYTSFTQIANSDVDAIYAFLRTVQPERYRPPANDAVFSQRWAMGIWNWLFFKPGRFVIDHSKSAEWNRGAYLVNALGHCDACHTPRNLFLAEQAERSFAGGSMQADVAHGKVRRWSAVNLTSAPDGLAAWSVDNLTQYLTRGFTSRAGTFGPMNEVIVNSVSRLLPTDQRAMAVYIKSLPARASAPNGGSPVSTEQVSGGAALYKKHCETCHSASGRGGMFSGPPLAGSAVALSDDPASLINIVLYGPEVPAQIKTGGWETMKPYLNVLDDAEVASIANFVRGSWGNRARAVSASAVASQR
jgi:alcohol dehydrogenase (quinone), cytochrome c subunit